MQKSSKKKKNRSGRAGHGNASGSDGSDSDTDGPRRVQVNSRVSITAQIKRIRVRTNTLHCADKHSARRSAACASADASGSAL